MKRLKAGTAALLVITLLLCGALSALGANRASAELFNDTAGSFVCEVRGKSVSVFDVNNSTKYTYSFDYDVLACCVSGAKFYAATHTNQEGIVLIKSAKNGRIIGGTAIFDKKISNNTDISVDGSGNFYLINNKNNIDIFDSDGRFIRTTDYTYNSTTVCGGRTYALNSSGIYSLSSKSESKLCGCRASYIYAVSDNYLADTEGNVYSVKSGKKILSLFTNKNYTIAESAEYIIVLDGKTVSAYSKSDGAFVNSYELSLNAFGLCANGKTVYILQNGGYSYSTIDQKVFNSSSNNNEKILPTRSTKSDTTSATPVKGINFGGYKVSGRFIYLKPRTTRSEFRSRVSFDGYTLSFSRRYGLGTGTKAVFSKNGKDYVYTIVVMGDITGTGRVNSRDLGVMFNCLFGIDKVGGVYKTAADMNDDGKLSNVDLVMIDRKIN